MAKIRNNPILKGLSGMLGDVIVYRESRGKMIMSNRPKKRDEPTEHQKTTRSRFLQAVQYAKGQMLDPAAKEEYAAAVSDSVISAYGVAVADYLKGPEVTGIDTTDYTGNVGSAIVINAIDNFKVTDVLVEIRSSSNELIEQGAATQSPLNGLAWEYAAKQLNEQVAGSKVIVKAKDKPNNVTTREFVLS